MPLYEYRCRSCDHRFELLQRMGEGSDGLTCVACGAPAPKRLLSTFAATSNGSSSTADAGCAAPACGSGFT